jgi:putative FmdB family regulatory protein
LGGAKRRNRKAKMPIYEYRAIGKGCGYCRDGFEIKQRMDAIPLKICPKCGATVRRLVSRFRAFVAEADEEVSAKRKKIREFEKEGKWSHAAELADKSGMEERAKEDYKKAGYNV